MSCQLTMNFVIGKGLRTHKGAPMGGIDTR